MTTRRPFRAADTNEAVSPPPLRLKLVEAISSAIVQTVPETVIKADKKPQSGQGVETLRLIVSTEGDDGTLRQTFVDVSANREVAVSAPVDNAGNEIMGQIEVVKGAGSDTETAQQVADLVGGSLGVVQRPRDFTA